MPALEAQAQLIAGHLDATRAQADATRLQHVEGVPAVVQTRHAHDAGEPVRGCMCLMRHRWEPSPPALPVFLLESDTADVEVEVPAVVSTVKTANMLAPPSSAQAPNATSAMCATSPRNSASS
jgi:hypothetical protein